MKRFLLCLLLILPAAFMPSSLLFAFDFGLVLDQSVGVGGTGSDSDFDYDAATPNGGALSYPASLDSTPPREFIREELSQRHEGHKEGSRK